MRGTQLVLACGQQSCLTHTKILGSMSFKFFGRSHLLHLWQGSVTPPPPVSALSSERQHSADKRGWGTPWVSQPPVSPQGHMAQQRPWGEGL